jgi:dihydrolipoamide dehydrogenase
MSKPDRFDVVVIGAGTGGYVAAIRAAQLGLSVAVVERHSALGGTCLNWGCIPTKALLEHAHALKIVQEAADWGVTLDGLSRPPAIDMARVHARKDTIVSGITKGVEFLFKKNRIAWIRGTARLGGAGRVDVIGEAPETLVAPEIVIATGSRPRRMAGIAIDRERIITSDDAIALPRVPASLAVLGSGAVGVEFASIFRRFGSEVTLIELLPRIVPAEDEAVSAELAKAFRRRGIAVKAGARVTEAVREGDGVRIEMEDAAGGRETLRVETLLVAVGREPVSAEIGAAELGVSLDRGFIKVDPYFRTGVEGISAIGDVITIDGRPHPQLAHVSSAEGIAVAERVAGRHVEPINYDQVPACTYCEPEIGSVGLTEAEARGRGHDVTVGSFPFNVLGRAKIAGETEGFVKIVAEKTYDQVLGVHIIGAKATEVVAEAAAALRLEATVEELVRTIHAHPTMAEAIGEAAHAVHGAAIHL